MTTPEGSNTGWQEVGGEILPPDGGGDAGIYAPQTRQERRVDLADTHHELPLQGTVAGETAPAVAPQNAEDEPTPSAEDLLIRDVSGLRQYHEMGHGHPNPKKDANITAIYLAGRERSNRPR